MQIIPFSQPSYISVYRLLLCLKILRCLCVVTSWFATITFPVSAYIDSLCARTSMLVDPQHQYIVFLKQFLKGGFYTGKIWALPTAEITCSSKRRFLHSQKGKFLFHSPPCIYAYYSNSSVYIFHCLSKERFLHRKNRRISMQCTLSPPLYPIRVLGCTMINKREVSTPEKPAIVISTYVCTAEHSHYCKRVISTLPNL